MVAPRTPDPFPLSSPVLERERARIAKLTEQFLANGGEIQQVGFQMTDRYAFVIDPKRTPVYAHLFQPAPAPKAVPAAPVEQASPEPLPEAPAPEPVPAVEECPRLPGRNTAVRLMALGYSPRQAALVTGISEKEARQLARTFHITLKRQR